MLNSLAASLMSPAVELLISCSAVTPPIVALCRHLQDTGVALSVASSRRPLRPATQIAQLLLAVRSGYTLIIDDSSHSKLGWLEAVLAELGGQLSISAAGEMSAIERTDSYRQLLEAQPWWKGWEYVPDGQRTTARAFMPGFYLVRTDLLRRFPFPDSDLDHAQLAMLMSDMFHCLGEHPRQLPPSILSYVTISEGMPRKPWTNQVSSPSPLRDSAAQSPTRQVSAAELRSMLEAARDQLKARQFAEAERIAGEALKIDPHNPTALHILGMCHHRTGRREHALELVQKSIAMGGDLPEYHNNLGNILASLGRHQDAVASFRTALQKRPQYPEALNNLGRCLLELAQPAEAERCLSQAVELRPQMIEALNHRAAALQQLGRIEEALACRRKHVQFVPNNPMAHAQLAMSLVEMRRMEESEAEFAAAVRLSPEEPDLRSDRAMSWLLRGDFARGWPEYEWRLKQADAKPTPPANVPKWQGEDLSDRMLLIRCEQGLGATIQFIRYALLLADSAKKVIVECQPPLLRLLQSLPKQLTLLPAGYELPPADFWIPLLSIPGVLRTTLESIPSGVPYLGAERARVEQWKARLEKYPRRRIGVAWQGNPQYGGDRFRSIPLESYAPLAQIREATLISLQKGPGEDQLAKASFPIKSPGEELDAEAPFLDTAAIMMNLDLVITSDTSIAHLAGAMGKPVWAALSYTPDWRWMLDREDNPWYPTMRLFRQNRPGDWASVFSRMSQAMQSEPRGKIVDEYVIQLTEATELRPRMDDKRESEKAFGFFDQTYVLNLDSDTDRMKRVSARLQRLGVPYHRFSAMTPPTGLKSKDPRFTAGHYACALSHRAMLQQAWNRGLERVLILEDDVVLRDDASEWMRNIVHQLQKIPWDIFYLGLHLEAGGNKVGANLLEVKRGYHTHAYAVARKAMPRLIAHIDRVLEHLEGTFDGYEDSTLLKVCATPILAVQEPNHSHTYGQPINRLDQYFTMFDGDDFRQHCAELRELEAQS
jgi:Flp pilus assembly protein TadD/GR25 family glycosyltransferase involved in LPS biosynthesis